MEEEECVLCGKDDLQVCGECASKLVKTLQDLELVLEYLYERYKNAN